MLLVRLAFLPLRLAFGTVKLGTKAGYRAGSLLGYKRMFFFGAGVAVGLLVAPTPGRQLRAKLTDLFKGGLGAVSDAELSERVRFELSHSPRTWHLPQPDVVVAGGRVSLSGMVPHETGRADLERAAAAVPGVGWVDNLLVISSNGA
jgi:hypothetical protein